MEIETPVNRSFKEKTRYESGNVGYIERSVKVACPLLFSKPGIGRLRLRCSGLKGTSNNIRAIPPPKCKLSD